jgi:hypothetical protein
MSQHQFQHRGAPAVRREPRKVSTAKVRKAFDGQALAEMCVRQDFLDYATRIDLPAGRNDRPRFYYYKDNGSNILGIAHLDSVQDDGTANIVETNAGLLVTSGTLDDRLGAYVILDLLPQLGVKVDWLLTTDEEIAASTAEDFAYDWCHTPSMKSYDWMFQFDRGGTDVVMYQYETPDLCDLVEEAGARVGSGSFSDICYLDPLGCAGLNWGVGYQDYHGPRAHAWLEDTFRMVGTFLNFYEANKNEHLAHMPEDRDEMDAIDFVDGLDYDDEDEARLDDWYAQKAREDHERLLINSLTLLVDPDEPF